MVNYYWEEPPDGVTGFHERNNTPYEPDEQKIRTIRYIAYPNKARIHAVVPSGHGFRNVDIMISLDALRQMESDVTAAQTHALEHQKAMLSDAIHAAGIPNPFNHWQDGYSEWERAMEAATERAAAKQLEEVSTEEPTDA